MTLVKSVSRVPAATSRAGRRIPRQTERVLFDGSQSLSGRKFRQGGGNVRSNTSGQGRAFTPNLVQQRRFAHPVASARVDRPATAQPSALRRGVDIASRVATSRGGVLLSGIALVLSLGLSPLVMGHGSEEPTSATAVAASEIESAAVVD